MGAPVKDRCGQELAVGDKVVTTDTHYSELNVGWVVGFTPKMVRVSGEQATGWAAKYGEGNGPDTYYNRFPNQVAKVA